MSDILHFDVRNVSTKIIRENQTIILEVKHISGIKNRK